MGRAGGDHRRDGDGGDHPQQLVAIPNERTRTPDYAIEIPYGASLILTHDANAQLTGLDAFGIPANGPVSAVIGDTKGVTALNGTSYSANALPPYGVRVLYAAGGAFQGNLHGDRP